MSGHNRWSQIQRQKSVTDQKRGQIFSKLSRLLALAAKKGPDPKTNPALAQAMEKAKEANMPRENMERAIKKISDKEDQLEELLIEAIGPGGTALRIKAVTDSRLRTIAEVKKILADNESKMVAPGSLAWMFSQPVSISQEDQKRLDKLLSELDDQDEVEDVVSNLPGENS